MDDEPLPKNIQEAPFPTPLRDLVRELRLPPFMDWRVRLSYMLRDDPETHEGASSGLTLEVLVVAPDAYHPDQPPKGTRFLFPVPPATYDRRSWRRWLFDRFEDVQRHELMEAFAFANWCCDDYRRTEVTHEPGLHWPLEA